MSRIPAVQPIQDATRRGASDLRELDIDEFLQLMIAELQNQDPLDPMDNSEILQQINTIREISATNQLAETLDAVMTGQNLATASSMIGRAVNALTDAGVNVEGIVDRVTVEVDDEQSGKRQLRVHIGEHQIRLENVRQILGANESSELDS